MLSTKKSTAALALTFAAALALAGCSMGGTTTPAESTAPEPSMSESAPAMENDPAANLVGPGCEAYAEAVPDGAG